MEIGTFENIIYSATFKESDTSKSQTTTKGNVGLSCTEFLSGRESDDGVWAPTTTKPSFTMNIHDPQKDAYISGDISKKGCFECEVLYAAMAALAQEPKSILIDVGGNIGLYSLSAASMGHKSFIFEPVQRNYERICRSMLRNEGFEDKITLFANAVTKTDTTVEFTQDAAIRLNMGAFIMGETKMDTIGEGRVEGVDFAKGIPLEALKPILFPSMQAVPVVIKVDVEGNECAALMGGMSLLRELNLHYVTIEWSYLRLSKCTEREQIFDLLLSKGLKPYMLTRGSWELLDTNLFGEDSMDWKQRGSFPLGGLYDIAWSKEPPKQYKGSFSDVAKR